MRSIKVLSPSTATGAKPHITDLANDVVLDEKIKQALTQAHEKQTKVLGEMGFQGAVIPATKDGKQAQIASPDRVAEAKKLMDRGDPAAAIALLRHKDNQG